MNIEEYSDKLRQDVLARAQETGGEESPLIQEEAFFDVASTLLIDAGEVAEVNYTHYNNNAGIQIDGYGGPLVDEGETLKLFLVDYDSHFENKTIGVPEVQTYVDRGTRFLRMALGDGFHKLEESSDAYALAKRVRKDMSQALKIKFILISNRQRSSRFKDGVTRLNVVNDTEILLSIWDLSRMAEAYGQGEAREQVIVDFDHLGESGYTIPVLDTGGGRFASYLAAIPGEALADIYDKYSTRLLEANVRVFLQAKGKVNQGIQRTLLDEPDMFFAYNNGLSATVSGIEFGDEDGTPVIKKLYDLQIVNGGQTTASVYLMSRYGKKRWKKGQNPDLESVLVQLKISVVPEQQAHDVVSKISRFANSQNKVTDADFFANHPYHVAMEQFSQRLVAQPREGLSVPTRWFYERMRGQYQNAKNRFDKDSAKRKTFEKKNPTKQVITKTDLAKFLMPWEGKPEIAQKGAAKCFVAFSDLITARWEKDPTFCHEEYFRECVAKAILFRATENIVTSQPWYEKGGTRAPIVIHTLGKLSGDLVRMNKVIPFSKIWASQEVTPAMRDALSSLTTLVKDEVLNPPATGQLPTEWAKSEALTRRLASKAFSYPEQFIRELVSVNTYDQQMQAAREEHKQLEKGKSVLFVLRQGGHFWQEVLGWGQTRTDLTDKELELLGVAATKLLPDNRQCEEIYGVYLRLRDQGLPVPLHWEEDDALE